MSSEVGIGIMNTEEPQDFQESKEGFVVRHPNITVCFFSIAGSVATTLAAYFLGGLLGE